MDDDFDIEIGDDLELLPEEPTDLVVVEDDEQEIVGPSVEERAAELAERITERSAEAARLTAELAEMAAEPQVETGTALVPSTQTADAAKRRLATLRADAMRQSERIEAKREQIEHAQNEMKSLMRDQIALAMEKLRPLEKFVARLQEGIWMVNLYLGRDEEIVTLYDEGPADPNEVISIRQMVLAMDEECAVAADDGGIDALDIDMFDEWLQADFAHVEQIAPEERCVVALRPRFGGKEYADPWKQVAVEEMNKKTYFLIRNGRNVYRTWTEFNAGERLVPTADEFGGFFYVDESGRTPDRWSKHRVSLEPGTPAWERAEEAADARQRHYMRVGLILQGLVDRTTVFHPLPEGGVNFLDYEHALKTWRFVSDAEMVLETGRTPFFDWLKEKNQQATVGMRIVGRFARRYYRDGDDEWKYLIHPRGAELPPSGELLTIEGEEGDHWIVRYKRTQEVYDARAWVPSETRPGWGHHGEYRTPKLRASARLNKRETFYLPFDLVTVEEMQEYLGARGERRHYVDMFPLLKRAIKAKLAEVQEEQPFRVMLAGVLARENGVTVEEAEREIDALVEWWKLSNKQHRPLVGGEEEQAKAVRGIVSEHARRMKSKSASSKGVQAALALHPDALLVARKRDGKYVVLVPENDENVFVREFVYGARALAAAEPTTPDEEKGWRLMPAKARRVRWDTAYESERFASWDFAATLAKHLTDPEIERLLAMAVDRAREDAGDDERLVAVAFDPGRKLHERAEFRAWYDSPGGWYGRGDDGYKTREWGWKREGGLAVLGRENYGMYVRDWNEDGLVVGFHDPEAQEAHEERVREVEAKRRAEREHEARVAAWIDSIKQAWQERNEANLYARFLEEYLDPELWEGHRKMLKPQAFAYPHDHFGWNRNRSWWREKRDALYALVSYAVEQGVDLDGLTVWEASEHFPPVEWFGEPQTGGVHYGGGDGEKSRVVTHVEEFPEAIDIPADIRELRFKAEGGE